MKIAYDPQIFCMQTYGGASRYFCEIASRIAKQPGIQVSITAPMHINAYLGHLPPGIISGFRIPNPVVVHLPATSYPRLMLRGMGYLLGDWMLRAIKPEIIHETYFFQYPLGLRKARRVLTIYDMIHEKFAANFPHADKTARHKALAAKHADHVICISESTRRDAIEILGLPTEKTSVIHLGYDLMNAKGIVAENQFLPTSKPFLLYVGSRGEYKNFFRLLKAYGASAQLKTGYMLICFGGGAFNANELQTIQATGLDEGQVLQLGGDDALLAKLYDHASAFIYPSLYEGFGIPPLEAMSHGCPVICSNTSSIPEVVGDAGEYFEPLDIENIRVTIERVVLSDSNRESLIAKGRARLKCFSWDRCAAETLDVYQNLI